MKTVIREVTWGDALVVEVFKTVRGLRAVTERIAEEAGPYVGTRNTFAKLLRVDNPERLSEKDRWRAWLLLAALRQNPPEWGIPDEVVPASMDRDMLRKRLWCAVRDLNPEPAD